jgi:hypothetical protein
VNIYDLRDRQIVAVARRPAKRNTASEAIGETLIGPNFIAVATR